MKIFLLLPMEPESFHLLKLSEVAVLNFLFLLPMEPESFHLLKLPEVAVLNFPSVALYAIVVSFAEAPGGG